MSLLVSPLAAAQTDPADVLEVSVRRNINKLNAQEIEDLRAGIRLMQSRPDDDPASWIYQANIHSKDCQHGTWFFLSWHRMYLYHMEKILREAVREATKDPERDFALPYWNYSDSNARMLPEQYRQPADESNVLFVSDRSELMNSGGRLLPSAVDLEALTRFTKFSSEGSSQSFGGRRVNLPLHNRTPHSPFEGTPHDTVHGLIGGWMGSFLRAARDPVFWLHHANIDRLWERWLSLGDGRANPSDDGQGNPWLEQEFEFFDVETDELVKMTGAELLDTAKQLGYKYDSLTGESLADTEQTPQTTEASVASRK